VPKPIELMIDEETFWLSLMILGGVMAVSGVILFSFSKKKMLKRVAVGLIITGIVACLLAVGLTAPGSDSYTF
jgi:hypothetical protein